MEINFQWAAIPAAVAVGTLLVTLGGNLYKLADLSQRITQIEAKYDMRYDVATRNEMATAQSLSRLAVQVENVSEQLRRCRQSLGQNTKDGALCSDN